MAIDKSLHKQDEKYMQIALDQACKAADLGEVPIGAVVVYDPVDKATQKHVLQEPRILAMAGNRREQDNNPAGHAEFLAMQCASKKLDSWRLSGCSVYVTLEPCIMCAGLMHQARIDRCVFGAYDPKAGALGSLYEIHKDQRLNHCFEAEGGVLEEKCAQMLRNFFVQRRKRKS